MRWKSDLKKEKLLSLSSNANRQQNWVLNEIMDRVNVNVYVTDLETDQILFMNKTMKRAFGLEHPEGCQCWEILQTGLTDRCSFCPIQYLNSSTPEPFPYVWEEKNTKNGRIYENYDSLMRWIDGRVVHFQHSIDVTEARRLSHEATIDELTGTLNRRAGKMCIQEKLDSGQNFVLCMLDVNNLKKINDALGHQAGDARLISVVEAIREQLHPSDCLFRLSGDEFVVLFEDEYRGAFQRMLAAQESLKLDPNETDSFCFGLAEATEENRPTLLGLLNSADANLYTQKRKRRIRLAEEKLQNNPRVTKEIDTFTYDKTLLYDALSKSTENYLYVCNMKSGVFRYPQTMVDEFNLPGQVIENAAAVWGNKVHPHDKAAFLESNQDIIEGRGDSHCVEYRVQNKKGEWVWMRCRGHVERDEKGEPTLFAGFITNLGKKNKIDQLTGLFNKIAFEEECEQLLETGNITMMLLGIDGLKHINGLYDRGFGDEVIRIVSQRIQSLLPPDAQMFRLDGDEFGILIRGAERGIARSLFYAIHETFSIQQAYENKRFSCSLSCGCVIAPQDGKEYLGLLKRASYALEFAKHNGKDRIEFFAPELLGHRERRLKLTELLRESVEQRFKGFSLHFQPIFDAKRKLVGAEALCRWNCPQYGQVPPGEFIGLLEESGMIQRAGRWIFREAIRHCAVFLEYGPKFSLSVNLSWLQFKDETLPDFLLETVKKFGVDPKHILLELTENCFATNLEQISEQLNQLRKSGFRIAIDDFGTGYSSLGLLKRAPIDIVKLDRTFTQGIRENAFDRAFIRLAAELCHIIGMRVCLEGVETEEEYAVVQNLGIDYLQGFLLGKPCNLEHIKVQFLEKIYSSAQ